MNSADTNKGIGGLLAGLGLLFVGCDTGNNPASPVEPLIGKWNFTGVSYKSEISTLPESPDYPFEETVSERNVKGEGYYIDFKPDWSFTASFPSAFGAGKTGRQAAEVAVDTGEWSMQDSLVTLIQSGETRPDTTRLNIRTNTASTTFFSTESFSLEIEEGYVSTSVTTISYIAEKESSP